MDISKRLKELREIHNLTQEELAKGLNVSRTTISNYENGSRSPDIEMINNIADFYNITINSIFSDEIEYKPKQIVNHFKYKVITVVALLFSTLIIILSNIIPKGYNYGYDIYDDELKVKNSEVISIVEVLDKIDNNTYKVNFIKSLKGPSFTYLSIMNKDIEVKYDTCYLVFSNLIKDNEEYKDYISIDTVKVYDYLFFYELENYDKSIMYTSQDEDIESIIDYYLYYINKEKEDKIEYSYLLNPRTEEYKINSKDCFSNPYDTFDLDKDFNNKYYDMLCKGYKYLDIEISMRINEFKANKANIYLYRTENKNIKYTVSHVSINSKLLKSNNYDKVIINFTNVYSEDFKLEVNNKLVIRYDYEGTSSSYWTNSDVSIKIGFKH